MKKSVKVSVLIPSLNVGRYIEECLKSVIEQTLYDIEIICIDAGSTDGTIEVIKDAMKRDNRVRLIVSDKKSYGYQLNQGIEKSCGEFVGIVESDDYIKSDMYEQLYLYAIKNDAEVVKSDFDVFFEDKDGRRVFQKIAHSEAGGKYGGPFSVEDYINNNQETDTFIWNAIYKRSFLNRENIRFNESPGAAYQDCGFRYQIFAGVKKLYYLQDAYYCYRRDNSVSSMYNEKAFVYNFAECKYLSKQLLGKELDANARAFLSKKIILTLSNSYKECLISGTNRENINNWLRDGQKWAIDQLDKGILTLKNMSGSDGFEISEFISDINQFIDRCMEDADKKRKQYRTFFDQVRGNQRCIIFGAAKYGRAAMLMLTRSRLFKDIVVCDNDASLWGKNLCNTKISEPAGIIDTIDENNDIIVVASGRHSDEIVKQLNDYGVDNARIIVYSLDTNLMICTGNRSDFFATSIENAT